MEFTCPSCGVQAIPKCPQCAVALADSLKGLPDPRPLIAQLAGLLEDERVREHVQSALLKSLERWWGDAEALEAVLKEIDRRNAGCPQVALFTETSRKAHQHVLDAVYQKMIRSLTHAYETDGTVPRCPKCRSTSVEKGDGMYEFTEMICHGCGYRAFEDDYQIEEWYRE